MNIELQEKYILEYIKDKLNDFKYKGEKSLTDAKYHHNTSYCKTPSIITNGLLSMKDISNFGIKEYSTEHLNKMDDISSHVNGIDGISLSVMGLNDLYPDEYEYDPTNARRVDILVDNDINTDRRTTNYGNEFICYDRISPSKFRAVDIRLKKYIDDLIHKKSKFCSVEELVNNFNFLSDISYAILECKLDLDFREMSNSEVLYLDPELVVNNPKLIIKK